MAFKAPTLITISTSSAPLAIASRVSAAFINEVFAPSGKPITVQTLTILPSKSLAARATFTGLTQTEAKLYSFASLQSFVI